MPSPFIAAVPLVALGSDYKVFLTGRIWQEAVPSLIALTGPVSGWPGRRLRRAGAPRDATAATPVGLPGRT